MWQRITNQKGLDVYNLEDKSRDHQSITARAPPV